MGTIWKLDMIHAYLGFKIKIFGIAAIRGNFKECTGSFEVERDQWETAKINVEAPIAGIDTGNQLRDKHLQESNFFDSQQFPKWTFASQKITKSKKNQYLLVGDLTLKGITKSIVIKLKFGGFATDKDDNQKAGFSGKATIKREDFGIAPNAILPNGNTLLGNKIILKIDFQLIK